MGGAVAMHALLGVSRPACCHGLAVQHDFGGGIIGKGRPPGSARASHIPLVQ
jgi:hypothetical protein